MENNSGSFEGRGNQDQLSRVHPLIQAAGLLLQQNSHLIANNQPLKPETFTSINEQVQSALETSKTTAKAYISNPNSFQDPLILCAALNILLQTQTEQLNKAKESLEEAKGENRALNEKNNALEANVSDLMQQLNSLKGTPSLERQLNDTKQDLQDTKTAIKMQQTKYQNEIEQLKQKIQEGKTKYEESEAQISKMQQEENKTKREVLKNFQAIADAFDVPVTQDGNAMVSAIKQRLLLEPTEENIVDAILTQIRTVSQKYNQLLAKFNVGANSENVQAEIIKVVENAHSRAILTQLRQDYDIDPSITDVVDAVHSIQSCPATIVADIVQEFNLPEDTTPENIVDVLREHFAGSFHEEEEISPEHEALRQENEQLKQKQKIQEMLLSIIATEPVVYEQFDDNQVSERELQIEQEAAENLQHISNIASDLDSAQKELQNYEKILQENQKKLEELQRTKDEQIAAAKREIRNQYKARVEKLEGIVNALTPNEQIIEQLKRKAKTLVKERDTLTQKAAEYEQTIEDLTASKEDLNKQLNEQLEANENLKGENNKLQQTLAVTQQLVIAAGEKSEANDKYQNVIAELSNNNQQTTEELAEHAQQRNALFALVHKQQQLIVALEESLQRKILKQQEHNPEEEDAVRNRDITVEDVDDDDSISTALSEVPLTGREDDLHDLEQIMKSDEKPKERDLRAMILMLTKLNEDSATIEKMKEEAKDFSDKKEIIKKLQQMLHQQLMFIERILQSGDNSVPEDMRQSMTENVARIHDYLSSEGAAFAEEQSLFDLLGLKADPLELKEGIEKLFSEYEEIESDDGIKLLVLLRQAITASLVLKRLATEATKQCQRNANELKLLKADMENFRQDVMKRAESKEREAEIVFKEVTEKREELERKQKGIQNILRSNITNPDALSAIDQCIEQLNEGAEFQLDEGEYQKTVEMELVEHRRRLQEATEQLTQTQTELDELRQTTTREIEEVHAASGQLQEEAQTVIQTQGEELMKLRDDLKGAKEQFEKMKTEFASLNTANQELKAQAANEKKRADAAEKAKEEEVNRIKEKAAQKVDKVMKILAQEQKVRIDKLAARIKAVQRELKMRDEEIQKRDDIIAHQNESNEKLSQNCTQIEEEMQQTKEEHEQVLSELRNQVNSLQDQNKSLELEKKVLQNTIKTQEDKAKRDKQNQDSQSQLRQFKQEAETQKKIDAINDEYSNKNKEFIRQIYSTFPENADFTRPLNNASAIKLLEEVSEKMKLLQRDADKTEDLERQIKEVRNITNCPKGMRTSAAIADIMETVKEQNEKISQLEQVKLQQSPSKAQQLNNEWEDWAKRMHKVIASNVALPQDMTKLRTELETALFASTSDKTLMSKMEILRAQKKIFSAKVEALQDQQQQQSQKSFLSIVCLLMFTRRVQKLAKTLPDGLSYKPPADEVQQKPESPMKSQSPRKSQPSSPRNNSKSISSVFGASVLN